MAGGGMTGEHEARRNSWLMFLGGGEKFQRNFLQGLRRPQRSARDVMGAPVVNVSETTEAEEIARVLTRCCIKRVPVVHDSRVVGIVSRADLVRMLGAGQSRSSSVKNQRRRQGMVAGLVTAIEDHFDHRDGPGLPASPRAGSEAITEGDLTVAGFQDLVAGFEHQKAEHRVEAHDEAAQGRRKRVEALIGLHSTDEGWRSMIHHAREAAEHGQKELMVVQFPASLCSDGGRAVNTPLPDWPETLRGEPGEMYLRWKRDLKSRGFRLEARVLDFPGGMPGDIGLFLVWGE